MSNNPYLAPGHPGRNRMASNSGPQGIQRSYASQLKEHEPLFDTYEHLQALPRGDAALVLLRKVASMVKPIMRTRGWHVQILAEFLPPEQNLLGLNINKGYKICIRLRYHNNPDLFLPIEQLVDTMLHELSHIIWGEHDSNFHKLWDELRDEYEVLARKGYTGEGFLSEGRRLGGSGDRMLPQHELRRLARESAEKRKAQGTLGQGSGQRLGGTPLHLYGGDVRQVIADQVTRRNQINRGCASGRQDAGKLSDQSAQNTFKTKADEDDANNRAIAQALFELMEQEETQKLNGTFQDTSSSKGLAWSPDYGLHDASIKIPPSNTHSGQPSEDEQMAWALRESTEASSAASAGNNTFNTDQPQATNLATRGSAPPVPLASKPQLQESNRRPMSRLIEKFAPKASSKHKQFNTSSDFNPNLRSNTFNGPVQSNDNLIDLTGDSDDDGKAKSSDEWACEVCTCINPMQFLACDACGIERSQSVMARGKSDSNTLSRPNPRQQSDSSEQWKVTPRAQPETLGWTCSNCRAFMEHKWWTCSACGVMKSSS